MKKILIISNSFLGNNPRGIRARNISEYLKASSDLHILAFDYYINKEIEKNFKLHKLKHSLIYRLLQKDIFFPKLKNTLRRKIITIISIFIRKFIFPDDLIIEKNKIIKKTLSLHKKYNFDIIIGLAQPFSMYYIGNEIKKHDPNIKWVLDIGDPFFNNAIKQNYKPKKIKNYEEKSLLNTDLIILTNKYTMDNYIKTFPILKEKRFGIIPQGANLINLKNKKNKKILIDKINLIYAGIFYPKLREPHELFKAIKHKKNIYLNIFGAPNIYKNLDNRISFKGRVSNAKVLEEYQNSDILIFIDNATGFQTSGKIYELLAIRKPILFIYENDNSPTKEILQNYNFIVFTKNNYNDIINGINKIITNSDKFIYNFNINEVSWETRANNYKELLDLYC